MRRLFSPGEIPLHCASFATKNKDLAEILRCPVFFSFGRYIVDGETMHDPELPALKTEQGHYNNMVKLRPASGSTSVVVVVKTPKLDNLKRGITDLAFAAKAVSKAVVTAQSEIASESGGGSVNLRKGIFLVHPTGLASGERFKDMKKITEVPM